MSWIVGDRVNTVALTASLNACTTRRDFFIACAIPEYSTSSMDLPFKIQVPIGTAVRRHGSRTSFSKRPKTSIIVAIVTKESKVNKDTRWKIQCPVEPEEAIGRAARTRRERRMSLLAGSNLLLLLTEHESQTAPLGIARFFAPTVLMFTLHGIELAPLSGGHVK